MGSDQDVDSTDDLSRDVYRAIAVASQVSGGRFHFLNPRREEIGKGRESRITRISRPRRTKRRFGEGRARVAAAPSSVSRSRAPSPRCISRVPRLTRGSRWQCRSWRAAEESLLSWLGHVRHWQPARSAALPRVSSFGGAGRCWPLLLSRFSASHPPSLLHPLSPPFQLFFGSDTVESH